MPVTPNKQYSNSEVQAVYLAYLTVLQTKWDIPLYSEIKSKILPHFRQEFVIDVLAKGRMKTYGALDQDELKNLAESGRFDSVCPGRKEILDILIQDRFVFIDDVEYILYGYSLIEVW